MASVINAVSGGSGGVTVTGDTSGQLALQTSGSTAVTVNSSQQATFVNNVSMPNTFGFKNRIINGSMTIDQRNSGSSYTPTSSSPYTVDRWAGYSNQSGKFTTQQVSDAPAGFTYSTKITSSSAYSIQSNDYFSFAQQIEGYNVQDIAWGTVNSQYSTLSFWVKSSLTGSFGGSIQDSSEQVCFAFTYTITAANTWQYQTVTILPYTGGSGTWGRTNSSGCFVWFGLGAGSGRTQSVTNQWTTTQNLQPTSTTQVVATNGATIQFTGIQLEVGTQATSFDYRAYVTELALCQRYCISFGGDSSNQQISTAQPAPNQTTTASLIIFPVTMRAVPTLTYSALADFASTNNQSGYNPTALSIYTNGSSTKAASISATLSSTYNTTGYSYYMYGTSTSSRMIFSADL